MKGLVAAILFGAQVGVGDASLIMDLFDMHF